MKVLDIIALKEGLDIRQVGDDAWEIFDTETNRRVPRTIIYPDAGSAEEARDRIRATTTPRTAQPNTNTNQEIRVDPEDRPERPPRPTNIANVAELSDNQLFDFDKGMHKLTRQEKATLRDGGTIRRGGLNFDAEAVQDMRQRFTAYRANLIAQRPTPNEVLGPVRDDTELVRRRIRMNGLIATPLRLFGRMAISPGVQMAVYENLYRALAEELLRIENLPADQRPQARQEYIQTRNEIIGAWFVNVLLAGLVVAPASAVSAILANIQEDRVRAGNRFRRFLRSAGRNKLVKLLRYIGTEYGLYQLTNLGMQQDAVREAILEYAKGEFLTKLNEIGYGLAMAVESTIDENWPDSWSQTDVGSWDEISDRFDMPSPSDVQVQPETAPNSGPASNSEDLLDPNEIFQ